MPNWLSDILSDLRYRFRAIFHRSEVDRDLDDEVRFHVEQEARKLESAGMSAVEARRQARAAFGASSGSRTTRGM